MNRRTFIGWSLGLAALTAVRSLLLKNKSAKKIIPGKIIDDHAARGHLLRSGKFPEPSVTETKKIVIVGGGVSGLSAARYFSKSKEQDFLLLELSDEFGGNAVGGKNAVSSYPWGAHYIPVPNNNQKELLDFLAEHGIITGYNEEGLPIYNEYALCFDPEERLFIHGYWQEGIIPKFGVAEKDLQEINRFLGEMDRYRQATGKDGKEAFAIPVAESSRDTEFATFDRIPMKEFLVQNNFQSPYLHWYVNYCCKDDFGTRYEETSAWAGIHYFAGRKGKGANAEHQDVLTWPEGNSKLTGLLASGIPMVKRRSGCIVYAVTEKESEVEILYYDDFKKQSVRLLAEKVILCTPQFVNNRLLSSPERKNLTSGFSYSPWMVANLTVNDLPSGKGASLSWDNVIYDSDSLGYVNACNQHLNQHENKKVLTYYLPLCKEAPAREREKAYGKKHEEWMDIIVSDLKKTQPLITDYITEADVRLWGHAMIQPRTGFLLSEDRLSAAKNIHEKIFFAHTDLSGFSIFEEGFYHGNRAAREVLHAIELETCTG